MNGKIENLLKRANESNAADSSVTSSTRNYESEIEAASVFQRLREKLFSIEKWNAASEITSFSLYDSKGTAQPDKIAAVGDFIKTVLPGSGKNDWVEITEISDLPDEIVLTVQPSRDPTDRSGAAATVSHFFAADSTNNFCLQKKGSKINFYVIGLNEKSNTEDTGGIVESVRNFATANIGYFFGIQKTQWQTFCDNFITVKD